MKFLVKVCAWILSVFAGALLVLCLLSYEFIGTPWGLIKLLRTFQIVEMYYAGNVDKESLLTGALEGIVADLEDRHSLYLDGEVLEQFTEQTQASYAGIGVYIAASDGGKGVLVAGTVDDSPAGEAGLQRGDLIMAVDGVETTGLPLEEVSKKIRGKADSIVTLTVLRGAETREYTLTRRRIQLKTVAGEMVKDSDIGYIRIISFSENTGKEFGDTYEKLKSQGMKRIILDLRNNPGGLVDQAAAVANYIMPAGTTVVSYTKRDGAEEVTKTDGQEELLPLVVLVNENSASAAEIVSGDIQDLGLGTIVGVKTYGKGTVQGVYPVDGSDAVKLTVAKYKTAKGREIDGVGVVPDVEVKLRDGDTRDYQFDKAVELLVQ